MPKNPEANFYKIEDEKFSKVFPKLLEGIISKGNKILVLTEDEIQTNILDDLLWVYAQLSFLPHATYKDEFKEENPIYITTSEADNANKANFIAVAAKNYTPSHIDKFDKYLFFYNHDTMPKAKKIAQKFLELGGLCNYIIQDKLGQWSKSGSLV